MTVETLITECRRLQEVLDNHYMGDLDPVIHLSFEEAASIYSEVVRLCDMNSHPPTSPVPGTFWLDCYGIRLFVERIGE